MLENKNVIYVVGMGPGEETMMTEWALQALEQSDVIIGYTLYLELLGERFADKEKKSTPMRQELQRCRMCFEEAQRGKRVAMVCSGDAGVYGMAAPMYELLEEYPDCELVVIPGITAACSGAALLGAPINHDFCVISLSDLLTPWEVIAKRLAAAAQGDFAVVLYNPSSRKRADYLKKACEILLANGCSPQRACGYVENIGREGTRTEVLTLEQLKETAVNMFTTVFIGNSQSVMKNGKLITKRGYRIGERE
ncbi:MAG: precorrin-3B C(17)-methyltransferase [Lachnospiraceae bacterium]|nr:precorrin-3B C(17)-methyltransferase [Lachnospiraceae bacterium]